MSVHRVLLAWLQHQAPHIIPLVGASRPASIRDSATPLEITDQDLAELRPATLSLGPAADGREALLGLVDR